MADRVTDEMVMSVLGWARNYEEIESYKSLPQPGRRWRVEIPQPLIVGSGLLLGWGNAKPQDVVPKVNVFTSREAVAFGYGCAAGGIHNRAEFARERWGWGDG